MAERTTHRVQLALDTRSYEVLQALKEATGAASFTETIRGALATLQWLRNRSSEGFELLLRDKEHTIRVDELIPTLSPPSAPQHAGDGEDEDAPVPETAGLY